jgi:TRAP-type transport system periplasmic protein
MTKSRAARLALSLLAAATLAGCAVKAAVPPGVTVIRYASPYPPNHPFSRADIAWMREVEHRSGGRLRIEPYWGGALVSSDETTLELAHGVADMALVTPIYERAGMTAIKVQAGFYAGATTPAEQVAVYRCLERQFPVLDREMDGVKVLAVQGGNLPNLLTRRRPITSLDQLRGMRIRTPSEIAPLLKELGADPVTMPMGEVYSALSKGVIDGVIAPADTLKSLHFNEVAPYLNEWVVPRGAYPARAMSDRTWERLPNDLRALLTGAQSYWEAQLNSSVEHAEQAGIALGHASHEHFVPIGSAEEDHLTALYDKASLQTAREKAKAGEVDYPAMFAAAHAAIANLRLGRPACAVSSPSLNIRL